MRNDCDAVWPQASIKHRPRLQCVSIDPSQSGSPAIGYEDLALVGDDARRFWKAVQRCEMAAGIVIDHLDAVPSCMCHKNAAAARLEGSMVEQSASRIRNVDDAHGLKRHSGPPGLVVPNAHIALKHDVTLISFQVLAKLTSAAKG